MLNADEMQDSAFVSGRYMVSASEGSTEQAGITIASRGRFKSL
jgi:hypothetical protein